jgi:glutamate formiminotransferase / formiminotetrahydrofolate cyclodeaminase
MSKLVECVPNFSEGRNPEVIKSIAAEVASVAGVTLLDVDPGDATNRTVVTFVGGPDAVVEAAFLSIAKAAELIDMRQHQGAHARQGATDVCPFVPISGVSIEECVELANRLAKRVGEELKIPVYLYSHAAKRPERKKMTDIRVGEYEALEEKLTKPEWAPDYGPAEFNATAGATVIGVRPFLIAYNINLNTRNTKLAKQIGWTIREKGRAKRDEKGKRIRDAEGDLVRTPGLPECQATGWFIEEYGRAQVTMNLTNYEVTSIHTAFDRVCELAEENGVRVTGSEVVGLIPKEPLLAAGRHYLAKQNMSTGVSEKELIEIANLTFGFSEVQPFVAEKKVIEYQVAEKRPLVTMTVEDFTDELGSDSPAPGGGSVAALAGSLAGALVSMVGVLTHGKKGYKEHNALMEELGAKAQTLKDRLMAIVDDDTAAFNLVMDAFRLPKKTEADIAARDAAILEANKGATRIPFEALDRCVEVLKLVEPLVEKGNQNSLSDAGVAGLMARAGAEGAYYNVLINLSGIDDASWCAEMKTKADGLLAQAETLADVVRTRTLEKLSS